MWGENNHKLLSGEAQALPGARGHGSRFCFISDDPMANLIMGGMLTESSLSNNRPVVNKRTDRYLEGCQFLRH